MRTSPNRPSLRLAAALAAALAATASLARAQQLPPPPVPPQNPLTPSKVVLGKILFWDEQLSSDDSVACGTCHLPEFGGTDGRATGGLNPGPDGVFATADDIHGSAGVVRQNAAGDFVAVPGFGVTRQATGRNANTTIGAAWHLQLFWDGRASSQFVDPETNTLVIPSGGALESQALGPILSPVEMGHDGRTWNDVRAKLQNATPLRLATNLPPDVVAALQQNPTYPSLFAAAFGTPTIDAARIAMAIASYQRTLVPNDTPWDHYVNGQAGALTTAQLTGWQLFQNQGGCAACHTAPLFSDDLFHNLGLRYAAEDVGRAAVTQMPADVGAFKTPSLRNAGLRPRLFHNGQSPALGDPTQTTDPASTFSVYFAGGGVDPSHVDPLLLSLSQQAVPPAILTIIQDFVRTALTDPRAAQGLPPFDHPTLRSAAVPPPQRFGAQLAGASVPQLIDTVPSFPGNAAFKLGVAGGDGNGVALLTWGLAPFTPPLLVLGMPWHVDVLGWQPFALQGSAGQPGVATWHLPLPADPALATVPFYFQLFAADPVAPGGIAASQGWQFFVR